MSKRFMNMLNTGVLVADGAMGTMLQRYGLPPGECPERMNLNAPEVVGRIHREYVAAGAVLVETNTFGATPLRLARFGQELAKSASEINRRAVEIAREAVGDTACVLGSIGPLGELIEPYGDIEEAQATAAFMTQAEAFAAAGADACIVETMADLREALLAVEAAASCGLPVIAQLSYDGSGRTFMGVAPEEAAASLAAAGACVIGANCSVGPEDMIKVIGRLRAATTLPVSALPNAGMPATVDGATHWPLDPAAFAAWGVELAAAGASIIGGCCGTTPEYIAALKSALHGN